MLIYERPKSLIMNFKNKVEATPDLRIYEGPNGEVLLSINGQPANLPAFSESEANKSLQVNEAGDGLVWGSCNTVTKIDLECDDEFKISAVITLADGSEIKGAAIDLPMESVVMNATYDNETKSLVLELQNGSTTSVPVAELINGLQEEITEDNKLDANLVDGISDEVQGALDEKADAETVSAIEERVTAVEETADKATEDIASANTAIEGLDTRLTAVEGKADDNASAISDAQASIETIESNVSAIDERLTAVETKAEATAESLETLEGTVGTIDSSLTDAVGRIDTLEEKVESLEGSVGDLETSVAAAQADATQALSDAADAAAAASEAADSAAEANSAIATANNVIEGLTGRVDALETATADIDTISEKADSAADAAASAKASAEAAEAAVAGKLAPYTVTVNGLAGQYVGEANVPVYFDITPAQDKVTVNSYALTLNTTTKQVAVNHSMDIPCATTELAGIMSAADKVAVDSIDDKADKLEILPVSAYGFDTNLRVNQVIAGSALVDKVISATNEDKKQVIVKSGDYKYNVISILEDTTNGQYRGFAAATMALDIEHINPADLAATVPTFEKCVFLYIAAMDTTINFYGTEVDPASVLAVLDNKADTTYVDGKIDAVNIDISKRVERTLDGSNGKALIFNESDGGGAKFEHTDGTWSALAVNDGGKDGIAAQIYALVTDEEGKKNGTRLDVTKDAIYYTVGNQSFSERKNSDNELATKGDVSYTVSQTLGQYETEIFNKVNKNDFDELKDKVERLEQMIESILM